MKKLLIITAIAFGLLSVWYYSKNPLTPRIKLHGHVFYVELAVTPQEKERGLGYRDALAPDHGMLFLYDHKEQYDYWMKGMRFPIDIVWIGDKTVLDITKNVPVATGSTLPTYHPFIAVDKVLELPAGTVDEVGIKQGDQMEILK